MTLNELVAWAKENGISLDTQLAIRVKDDYFIGPDNLYLDTPYFGNSRAGEEWGKENVPKDDDGFPDWDRCPQFLILDKED